MERSCTSLIAPGLIDTTLKLQLMLLFYRHPRWVGSVAQLGDWLRESPWALQDAIEGLVAAGLLGAVAARGSAPHYRLEPNHEHWIVLEQLVHCFDDPLKRDDIYALVRSADQERQFRALSQEVPSFTFLPA